MVQTKKKNCKKKKDCKLLISRDSIAAITQVMANKKIKLARSTELSMMDDETYGATQELKPLPECPV